ncbi:hypothetical protein KJ359_003532 [Pestalotiopsis sp. 9143b]|nr:hypothetical protein KJ359_003532 [Pestalotiopsis sp. 9143b]
MLMRQLQRPLKTRLLAAAWRSRLPLLVPRGSTRSQSSSTVSDGPEVVAAAAASDQKSTEASPSLFAALFPDEAKHRARRQAADTAPDHDSDPPPQPLPQPSSPLPQSRHPLLSYYEDSSHHPRAASESRCTVVLAAASPGLAASDFFRVGAGRAAHVEGWVGGIAKVVQARDPDTLEPLGRYYVTFGTPAAAAAWREEVTRLWHLSRAYTPGVVRSRHSRGTADFAVGVPVRAPGAVVDGTPDQLEAARREAQAFTLVPPEMRWSLEVAQYTAQERTMEHAGSLVEKLCRRAGTNFLVMVAVGGGRISPETLRSAIRSDGEERGLAWRVKNLETRVVGGDNDGESEWGIMPFGRSDAKPTPGATVEENLQEQGYRTMADADSADKAARSEDRRYARFLVPFADEAEARRFVRHWHRRHLTLETGHSDVDMGWEETRVLDLTYLW